MPRGRALSLHGLLAPTSHPEPHKYEFLSYLPGWWLSLFSFDSAIKVGLGVAEGWVSPSPASPSPFP